MAQIQADSLASLPMRHIAGVKKLEAHKLSISIFTSYNN